MIEGYEKFRMMDESGSNKHLFIEVNWNEADALINQCKVLKLTYPNGEHAFVKKDYFNQMLFAIGNPSEQTKMIPQKITRVRWYETMLGVKAKKDIRKGEYINFPIKISLPSVQEEIIAELKSKKGR